MNPVLWVLLGGAIFLTAYGLVDLCFTKKASENCDDRSRADDALLEAGLCAQRIAEKKVRVGEDWMKINPALFRVVHVHCAELCSTCAETKRLTTIVVHGVKPGTKIPRIVAKLEDSIIPLGFKREEIKVAVEAAK